MKKLTKKYQEKSLQELEKATQQLRMEIAKVQIESKTAPQKDTNILVKKRKELAVALTVLHQKKEIEKLKK